MKDSKKQWLPERLLINKNDIEQICSNYLKGIRYKEIFYAFLGGLLSYIITWASVGKAFFSNGSSFIVGGSILCVMVISRLLLYMKGYGGKIEDAIYDVVIQNMDHTVVFLIEREGYDIDGNPETSYLTQKHGGGESFFLYIKLDKINIENPEQDFEELKNRLSKMLGIYPKDIQLHLHSSYNNIKRSSRGGDEILIRYEFIEVYFNKYKVNEKSFPKEFEWKTMEMLRNEISTQKFNYDVVDYVFKNIKSELSDSFVELDKKQPFKIIWNITNKCEYNCEICATHSERKELELNEKTRVLLSILTAMPDISEIDFSGGDPLIDLDSCKIIEYARNILGKQKVYVTTTGKGIERFLNEKKLSSELLYNCEITIDDAEDINGNLRGQERYCSHNHYEINRNIGEIHNLLINVPILRPEMEEEKIREMIDNIAKIPVPNKKVVLIRLMEVGKMKDKYPHSYNPQEFIRTFQKYAQEKNIEVKLQCALRGKYENSNCDMLNRKIGIDCAGNVYACAWGGYIGKERQDNPFWLGNLLENNLIEILRNDRTFQIRNQIEKKPLKHCCVFSYIYSQNGTFIEEEDPLFKL